MTPAPSNQWTRNWTIVRADLDIAHVMLPLSNFKLETMSAGGKDPAFQVVHNNQAPVPDCFAKSVLVQRGQDAPSFFEITGLDGLPRYSQDSMDQYIQVSE